MKLYDIIDYTSNDDWLVYKHPCEDFNNKTKLIVRASQQAIFVRNGVVCDVFLEGRHTLSNENIPFLTKLMHLPTKGKNSFSSEIYFFNTAKQLNLLWGTSSKIKVQDPTYKIMADLGASGDASVGIIDPKKFLSQISGTKQVLDKQDLSRLIKSLINSLVRDCIAKSITIDKISILDINSQIVPISQKAETLINEQFDEYGLSIKKMNIENIVLTDENNSLEKLSNALSKKAEMDIMGYSYQDERGFDVMSDFAKKNDGGTSSSLTGLGVGLGLMGGIAQTTGNMMNGISSNISNSTTPHTYICSNCKHSSTTSFVFCPSCGTKREERPSHCPQCGNAVGVDDKFCKNCGGKI